MKKRIVIYGGSFNPPTMAHQKTIIELSNKFNEVWIIPSIIHRQKNNLINIDSRIDMLKLTLENVNKENIKIVNLEKDNDFQGKAYLLMEYIKINNPKYEFYYVIGTDIINNIKKWYNYENFISENNFLIIPRKSVKINDNNLNLFFNEGKNNIVATTFDIADISSTEVRNFISYKYETPEDLLFYMEKLNDLLSKNVLDYIENNNLYWEKNEKI